VKLISGGKVNLPALGFGMGDVVLLELLKACRLLPRFDGVLDLFCLIEDESLRDESLGLIQKLRGMASPWTTRLRLPNRTSNSSARKN
jgi:histidyl-tRNA synthetase